MIVLTETTIFSDGTIDWSHFAIGYYKPSLKKASQKPPTTTHTWGRHATCDLCDSPMPEVFTLEDDLVCKRCYESNTVDERIGKLFKTPIREFVLLKVIESGDNTYFQFDISTTDKPLLKHWNASECDPCQ